MQPYDHARARARLVDVRLSVCPASPSTRGPLKTLEDADALRNHLVWLLELADTIDDDARRDRLLTLVVVGGGFTGVETAGEIVELFRSVRAILQALANPSTCEMILVEAGPTLLAGLPAKMGEYSRRVLERRGIEVLTGDGVAAADERGLTLQSGRRIESETIVWSAGVKPSPTIAKEMALPKTKRGAIETRARHARSRRPRRVGARRLRRDSRRRGRRLSDDGAARDSRRAASGRQHRRRPARQAYEAVSYRTLGMMAALGGRKAVAQLPGDRVITGFIAWFFWRTYYLLRLPGLDRKLRVAFDWTLELLFPRDTAELRFGERATRAAARRDSTARRRTLRRCSASRSSASSAIRRNSRAA